jgi:hypothetical protein
MRTNASPRTKNVTIRKSIRTRSNWSVVIICKPSFPFGAQKTVQLADSNHLRSIFCIIKESSTINTRSGLCVLSASGVGAFIDPAEPKVPSPEPEPPLKDEILRAGMLGASLLIDKG